MHSCNCHKQCSISLKAICSNTQTIISTLSKGIKACAIRNIFISFVVTMISINENLLLLSLNMISICKICNQLIHKIMNDLTKAASKWYVYRISVKETMHYLCISNIFDAILISFFCNFISQFLYLRYWQQFLVSIEMAFLSCNLKQTMNIIWMNLAIIFIMKKSYYLFNTNFIIH